MARDGSYVKIMVRLFLSYSGDRPAKNVSITVTAPNFVHVSPRHITLPKVAGLKATPVMVRVFLYALKSQIPSGLDALVTASYTSYNGEPRVTSMPLQLPLFLACRPKAPVKSAACKVVLDTGDHPAHALTELFGDFLYAYQQSGVDVGEVLGSNATQAMGFQLFCTPTAPSSAASVAAACKSSMFQNNNPSIGRSGSGETAGAKTTLVQVGGSKGGQAAVVSVLVSKNAGRYRVQGESYAALYLVMDELERRLNSKIAPVGGAPQGPNVPAASGDASKPSVVKCTEPLPLDQYFSIIEAHYKVCLLGAMEREWANL